MVNIMIITQFAGYYGIFGNEEMVNNNQPYFAGTEDECNAMIIKLQEHFDNGGTINDYDWLY